jgi:isopenicillin N synthase-like dioxygenase
VSDESVADDVRSSGIADVPVIDIEPFFSGSEHARTAVVEALNAACEGIGFIMITGHGVPQDLIDQIFALGKQFFALPLEEKLAVSSPTGNRFQGYAAPNSEGDTVTERQSFVVNRYDTPAEAVAAGYPEVGAARTIYPALWPANPPGMRDVWRRYFEEMEVLAMRLLTIFEEALGLPEGWFRARLDKDQTALVSNYYSNDIAGREPLPYRFRPHVDPTVITILYQDDGPGRLQAYQHGMGWRDVLPVPGAFVLNLGAVMSRWTNDRYVATLHRVLKPVDGSDEPRMSVPFLMKPNHDAVIEPIAELIADGEVAKYAAIDGLTWVGGGSHIDEYDEQSRLASSAARGAGDS